MISELRGVVEALEDHQGEFPKALLEEFANKTDRIMGTANTFASMAPEWTVFGHLGKFGELCKATGYKAAVLNNMALVPIFAAFWADTLDIMEEMITHVGDAEKLKGVTEGMGPILQRRLVWLAQQIVNLTKGEDVTQATTINVDGILKKMGILA